MNTWHTVWLAVLLALGGVAPTAAGQDKKKQTFDGLKALQHPDATVRYQSADLLAQLGATARFALPALREALEKDKSIAVRIKIAEALWKIEKPMPALLLPTLRQGLRDKLAENRAAAAGVLALMGPKAEKAVSALAAALKDDDLTVRGEVATALGEIGPEAKGALPALLAATGQKDFDFVEPHITIALGKIGPAAVPALTAALMAKDIKRRRTAATALGLIGAGATDAVPALTAALADAEPVVRRSAAQALGQVGPGAKSAADKLAAGLKDKDADVRIITALALWRIKQQTAGVAVLTAALGEKSGYLRERALRALAEIGPAARPAVRGVAAALEAKDARERAAAATALGRLQVDKADAALLLPLLEDKDAQVRLSAAQSLWGLAPVVRGRALPVLTKELGNRSPAVRRRTAEILAGFGPDAREAVPALLEALFEQNAEVRVALINALKKIDPTAAAKAGIR